VTWEENEILAYLKSSPHGYFSVREICKRASGKKVFQDSPEWAKPHLPRLVERGELEMDCSGRFRLKSRVEPVQASGRRWVAPHLARLLQQSGRDFSMQATTEIADEG
jgi:hypothetical protein